MNPTYKNILCIRADNMGDVIMTGPALRALKDSFNCRVTLLTSRMGSLIASFMPAVDEVLVADLPWVKTQSFPSPETCQELIDHLRRHRFDLAIIFTVYSQNPLPAAFLCWMAGIPQRLAWCRENPYHLLTHWQPDEEPYSFIRHQVERDLQLVESLGAVPLSDRLRLSYSTDASNRAREKLTAIGVDLTRDYIILHPGVSEKKREYPLSLWATFSQLIRRQTGIQLVITGSNMDIALAEELAGVFPHGIFITAGLLTVEEYVATVAASRLIVCVNTAAAHIAAAVDTPVVVLYARTNPQHYPWKVLSKVLEFTPPPADRSRNEVIRYVTDHLYNSHIPYPDPSAILKAVTDLLDVSRHSHTNLAIHQ